jgi:putative Mg2+ transporter-C (MgtC) family protein
MDFELLLIKMFLPKILIATLCGFIIGYDREIKHKAAGIRTNILICVGCTIFTTLSFLMTYYYPGSDPSRIIGQIITGIGFIGAGTILKSNEKIVGVTTSSFIWIVSAIGVMIGFGAVITPVIISLLVIVISKIFERTDTRIRDRD